MLLVEFAGVGGGAVPDFYEPEFRLALEQVKSEVVMIIAHVAKNYLLFGLLQEGAKFGISFLPIPC